MKSRLTNSVWLIVMALEPLACSGSAGNPPESGVGGTVQGNGGAPQSQGGIAAIFGGSSSTTSTTGGTPIPTAAGGASNATTGGSVNNYGGAATGGTRDLGGSATGGNALGVGGAVSGGASSGGNTSGGTGASGGGAAGGAANIGGSAIGGKPSTGGSATGGKANTGGANTGGNGTTGGAAVSGGTTTIAGREGFYKELFMDVGVGLDHQTTLPAADRNGWEWEFVSTDDVNVQHSYMWGNANDDNGVLLYPDREPRFMMMWTGGGYGDHAGPVGATGIKNVQDFFNNGGSYSGSCNGNYMAWNWAYKLWPGQIQTDGFEGLVDGTLPDNSPLLKYFDFGGDHLISGLEHYSGGFETGTLPAGTEVTLIGKSHSTKIDGDGHPTGYAYKPSAKTGRVCGMNDHPEYAFQVGEVMNYFQACLRYAHDGVGDPDVKAALSNGSERVMDKSSADNNPAFAKIGDKQYHHFTVTLPAGTATLTVTLSGDAGYEMNLYLAKDTFAFASRASQKDTSSGASKTLTIPAPQSGTWYVGVECATTVTATKTSHGYDYSGNLAVLNGVKYSIKATWN